MFSLLNAVHASCNLATAVDTVDADGWPATMVDVPHLKPLLLVAVADAEPAVAGLWQQQISF